MDDFAPATLERPATGQLGDSTPHESAMRHVDGTARYIDDIPEPIGTLHGWLVLSTKPNAEIADIDLSGARALPGVRCVLTARDVPGSNDVAPVFPSDWLLAPGMVPYAGQAIVAIAADTRELAARAAGLVRVEYKELPAVLTVAEARAAGTTVGAPLTMRIGDAAARMAQATHTHTGRFANGGQEHFYLEGQIGFAIPGEDEEILVHSSTQHPSETQHLIAHVLHVPMAKVTVECRRMGGGFGGKETQAAPIACLAALMAVKTGRPVKLRLDRDADMAMTGKRHPVETEYTVGYDGDGRLMGIEMELHGNCGCSPDLSNAVMDRAMFHSDNGYYLQHARITGHRWRTNTASNTAFRGFGGPKGVLAIEEVMDTIARRLGRDPLDVRKANLYGTTDRNVTHYHQTVEDNVLHELIDQLEAESDYRARVEEIRAFNAREPYVKKGIALTPVKFGISFTATQLNQAGALVSVYGDGTLQVNHGGTEMGQGLHTKICQIAADCFGIDISAVRITATSTGKVPNTSATAASSGTDLNGLATLDACRQIKDRLVAFAAEKYGVGPYQIAFRNGTVMAGQEILSFAALCREAIFARVNLSANGHYKTPKIHWDRAKGRGRPFFYFAYGAAVSEVIIDTLTGENRLLRADILHDVGRSLNPAIDIGQIEGAYIQGVGWLTCEELFWGKDGQLKTHAPSTYKIPTIREMPPVMNVSLFRNHNREETIHRSKAVGEPPFMLGISAFMAVKDAAFAAGATHLDAPATPEAILKAIHHGLGG